jgi:hypothetical protein
MSQAQFHRAAHIFISPDEDKRVIYKPNPPASLSHQRAKKAPWIYFNLRAPEVYWIWRSIHTRRWLYCMELRCFLNPSKAASGVGATRLAPFINSALYKIQTRPLWCRGTGTHSLGLKKKILKCLIYCEGINPVILQQHLEVFLSLEP